MRASLTLLTLGACGLPAGTLVAAGDEELKEPSGLTACALVDPAREGTPLALAVDDDQRGLFVLAPALDDGESGLVLQKRLDFDLSRGVIDEELRLALKSSEDFEGLAWDGDERIFAITSHRNLSKPGECLLLEIRIDERAWAEDGHLLRDVRSIDLTGTGPGGSPSIVEFASARGIVDTAGLALWRRGRDKDESLANRYAFEVEGLAYADGVLLLGLKWPLAPEGLGAHVLAYDLERGFVDAWTLDLGGKGISSLDYDPRTQELWVVANPTGKPRTGWISADENVMWGRTDVYRVKLAELGADLPASDTSWSFERGKLEGLARVGAELWAAWDGGEPRLERRRTE